MSDDSARDDFIRGLTHDFMNPLSSILGFMGLLLAPDAKDPLSPGQRRMLAAVNRAAAHLLGTMRDLSDLSRIEEGLWPPEPVPVDLEAAAGNVLEDIRAFTHERGTVLEVESAPGTPPVRADEQMMKRFLDALFRAAERLTPEKGRITLRLSPDGDGVAGVLENPGENRSPAALKAALSAGLHEPRPAEGYAAFGPALARRIALAHGGSLTAEPRPGGGTIFRFRFPGATT